MSDHRTTVLFDFDGVIADSFGAAFATAQARCNVKTEEYYRSQFEQNIYVGGKTLPEGDHSHCNHDLHWWDVFVPNFENKSTLFEHMDEVVRKLAQEHRLVIISSSVRRAIDGFLARHNLAEYFEDILDCEVDQSKHKKIQMVFDRYHVAADHCVMITDTKGDVEEAREAGVDSIAVTWGFSSRAALETSSPWRIIELPQEIPSAVTEFFHGKGTAA
jgi:phosphoglycolate phosphatase